MKTKNLILVKLIGLYIIVCAFPTFAIAEPNQLTLAGTQGSVYAHPVREVLTEAYGQMGIRFNVKFFPAERAFIQSSSGEVDGEVERIIGIDDRYPNLVRVPVPVGFFTGSVFTKGIKFPVTGWDSLKPYKIAVVKGIQFSDSPTARMNRIMVSEHSQLFRMLDLERVDAAVTGTLTGLVTLQKTGIKNIEVLHPPISNFPLYHYLHKKNAQVIPELTIILEKMTEEGRIQAIWDHYKNSLQ